METGRFPYAMTAVTLSSYPNFTTSNPLTRQAVREDRSVLLLLVLFLPLGGVVGSFLGNRIVDASRLVHHYRVW